MEAEQLAALVQSAAEQVDFDEVHLISFRCTNTLCVWHWAHTALGVSALYVPSTHLSPGY